MKKRDEIFNFGALKIILIAVLLLGVTVWQVIVGAELFRVSRYIINEEEWKDVYSLSPDTSSVSRKVVWQIRLTGGKLSEPLFIETDDKVKCFKEAAKKIMEIEKVNKLEGRREKCGYCIYPIMDSNSL